MELTELTIMMIGKAGVGKSATANTILGQKRFTESFGMSSETKEVGSYVTEFDKKFLLHVVDCPGLMDTDLTRSEDLETAARNMAVALGKCSGGVDAFVLVMRHGRFTEEDRKTLVSLKMIFGDGYSQYLMVVLAGGDQFLDDLENEGIGHLSFQDWCLLQHGAFKDLYDDFGGRMLLVNNRQKDAEKTEAERRKIIQLVDYVRQRHGTYTSQCFEDAKRARDKFIVVNDMPILKENIQKKLGLLTSRLSHLLQAPSDSEKAAIRESVNDLKKEIAVQDRGTDVLGELLKDVEKVEASLDDIDNLPQLTNKLEETKDAKDSWSLYGAMVTGLAVVGGIGASAAVGTVAVAAAPVTLAVAGGAFLASYVSTLYGIIKRKDSNENCEQLTTTETQIESERRATEAKLNTDGINTERQPDTMEPARLTLLLIGRAGVGKSGLGNNILGRRTFTVSTTMTSLAKDVKSDCTEIDGVTVKVVDAPGIMLTDIHSEADKETVVYKMTQAVALCEGEVDAFLYVCKYGHIFTGRDRAALLWLKGIFGVDFLQHMIVVVTGGDHFMDDMENAGTHDLTFPEWCRTQNGFRQLLNICDGRVILCNNREHNINAMKTQVGEILEVANQLRQSKGRYMIEVGKLR